MENEAHARGVLQSLVTLLQSPTDKPSRITIDSFRGRYILVWSAREEKLDLGHNVDRFDPYLSRLKDSMRSGGVAVRINPERRLLSIDVREGPEYRVPTQLLVLRSGFRANVRAELLPNETRQIEYSTGDHFLIPVDQDAESKLRDLTDSLQYLPTDQQRNIYGVIARPDLEYRMDLIEARINAFEQRRPAQVGLAAGQAQGKEDEVPGFWSGASVWFERNERRLWWTLVITLILVAALGYLYWPLGFDKQGGQIDAQANTLLTTVSYSSAETITAIGKGSEISSIRSDSPAVDKKKFAIEVLKLEMVTRGISSRETKKEIASGDQFTKTSQMLEKKQDVVPANHRKLIALLSCDAFRDPNLSLGGGITGFYRCAFSTEDRKDAATALQELTALVGIYKDPPELVPPFAEEADRLRREMSTSMVTGVSVLYQTHHLGELNKNPFKGNFAAAVVKLELLRLTLLPARSGDLNDENQITDTVAALKDPSSITKIKTGRNTLLAWVLCQAAASANFNGVPIPGTGPGCPDSSDPHVKAGFETLTNYVSGIQ